MKYLFTLLLTCIGACAQTNYPPNSAPYNNHPTNWVYDCQFQGYGNMNPAAPYLSCGWYDELTNFIILQNPPPALSPTNLLIQILSIAPVSVVSGHGILSTNNYMTVNLGYQNTVAHSNYTVFVSSDLKIWSTWGSFIPNSSSGLLQLQYQPITKQFYRIYGPPASFFSGVLITDPAEFRACVCFTCGTLLAVGCFRNLKI